MRSADSICCTTSQSYTRILASAALVARFSSSVAFRFARASLNTSTGPGGYLEGVGRSRGVRRGRCGVGEWWAAGRRELGAVYARWVQGGAKVDAERGESADGNAKGWGQDHLSGSAFRNLFSSKNSRAPARKPAVPDVTMVSGSNEAAGWSIKLDWYVLLVMCKTWCAN